MAHYDCDECGLNLREGHADNCKYNPANEMKNFSSMISDKSPLGLRPQAVVSALRLKEIHEAIGRYLEAGKKIPNEWLQEFVKLNSEN